MSEPFLILEKWFPAISYTKRQAITLFIQQMLRRLFSNNNDFFEFIQQNIYSLDNLLNKHINGDMYIFGIVTYFCGMILSLVFNGKIQNEKRIMNIVLLYLLLDNVLDLNDPAQTKIFIKNIRMVINRDLDDLTNKRPLDESLLEIHPSISYYRKMIDGDLNTLIATKELFEAEVNSVHIQRNANLTKEEYRDICYHKGICTSILLYRIVTNNDDPTELEEVKKIGYCCQLIDDIMDYREDMNNNIHTIATQEYSKNGHLDNLVFKLIKKIDKLSPKYNIVKYLFFIVLLYEISKHQILSTTNRRKVDPHIYMNYIFGVDPFKELERLV